MSSLRRGVIAKKSPITGRQIRNYPYIFYYDDTDHSRCSRTLLTALVSRGVSSDVLQDACLWSAFNLAEDSSIAK